MTFPNGDVIEGYFEENVFKGNPYEEQDKESTDNEIQEEDEKKEDDVLQIDDNLMSSDEEDSHAVEATPITKSTAKYVNNPASPSSGEIIKKETFKSANKPDTGR